MICDLKEFLGWKLEDITEESVAEHVLSMEQPLTSGCELTLIAYNAHKKSTRGIKDKILENFRRLIEVQNELLNDDKNEELKKEKKDIEDKQKDLSEKLKSQLKELRVSYKYLKKHFSEEIERCKKTINSSEDKFIKYKNTKRIKNLKIKLEMHEREEENMENFLFKVEETEGKILLKEVRKHKPEIGGCALAAIVAGSVGIAVKLSVMVLPLVCVLPFIKGFYDDYKKSNEERKERKSKETEHDYMIAYQDLCNGYDKLMKEGTILGNFLVSVGIRHKENEKELKEKAESLKGKFKTQNETKVNVEEYLKDEKEKAKFLKKEAKEVAIRLEKAIGSLNKEKVRNEMAQAKVKARDLVYIKAYEFKIPMETIIQNQDIRELLTQQYALLVLNTDYKEKFKGICSEYRSLKEELKSKQLRLNDEQEKYVFDKEEKKHVMGKLAELNDEVDRLSKNFVQREHKENEPARKFDDEAINKLKSHVIEEIKQARAAAEQERKALIEEKNVVEEIVMQLQRSDSVLPSSAFSSVAHEPVAGPSWRI